MSCLVLEGGAQRGIYTAGVLDIFLDNGIEFDDVIAVSAGSIHGSSFVSKQRGRSIRYNIKYCSDKRYMNFHSLFKTGNMSDTQFCYRDLPFELDPFDFETFENSKTKMYAVCTNVDTGLAEYIECKDMKNNMDIIRASCSMPFVSKFVDLFGNRYLDGGIADSIPIKKAIEMGHDKIVVVLTRPKGYRKSPSSPLFTKLKYSKYPKLADAIDNRYKVYNDTADEIERLEEEGKIFAIRPSHYLKVSRMEKDYVTLTKMYNLGLNNAKSLLYEINKYLNK